MAARQHRPEHEAPEPHAPATHAHSARPRAGEMSARVGPDGCASWRPGRLSGGRQQRVTIARTLVTHPEVVLADEPTGAPDARTAHELLGLLRRAAAALGAAVVMVTHDPVAASFADRVVSPADGVLAGELHHPDPPSVADRMVTLSTVPVGAAA